ncbi:MAG: EAL domain-containing protein [Spiribacter salinus]|uniref:EAL domain-containing protein n=1 Tax=Spiribacter salinus TaxID=1335746 RepID=A0A540VP39_9GAMM|nr:MAG: EAL domain-containing protein [Spiribacter salinus]
MTMVERSSALLRDITEAFHSVFDSICTTVIVEGRKAPLHCAGNSQVGHELADFSVVVDALADREPQAMTPTPGSSINGAGIIAAEPLNTFPEDPATVLAFVLRDPDQAEHAVNLAHALTTEAVSELMLLRTAPFLSSAFAEVESGITVADPNLEDMPLVYINEAFTRLTGYARAEVLGRNCRFLQGHLRDQPGIQTMRNALARGVDCTTVLTNIRRDGGTFQNRLRLRPIRGADGHVSHVVGIQNDVSAEQGALQSLDLQKRRHASLIDSVASYVWHMNADGQLQSVDRAWLVQAGLEDQGQMPELATIRAALDAHTAATFRERWAWALSTLQPFEVTYPLPADSDSPRWFQDRITPVCGDEGQLLEWFGVSQEITALKHSQQILERTIQAAPTGMLVVDPDGTITLANAQAGLLFGYPVEAMYGMPVENLIPETLRVDHQRLRETYLSAPSPRGMGAWRAVRGLRQDGAEFDAEVGLNWFSDGQRVSVIAAITDQTEFNKAHKELERAAYQDRLTGCLSREGFAREMDERRNRGTLHPASLIVSMDISGLREINNAQGYDVGDQILQEAARRVLAEMDDLNLVARPGGGEFLMLLAVDRHNTPRRWRRRLERVFEAPFEVSGFTLFVTAAFGYVRLGSRPSCDAETLMNDAELALRRSQQRVSVTWTQYTRTLEHQARDSVATTLALRLALERHDLMLFYQPKVHMATGKPVSLEALLRWQHPVQGFIPPGEFIPLAEQSQLIGPIGTWVLRRACSDLRAWQDAGLEVLPVSVNVSPIQFQLGSIPDIVHRALTDFAIEPQHLLLEITESVFEEHGDGLRSDLMALSAMGVQLSLDDFGTGYSSLGHLHDYPFDEIKIDKTFIWQLNQGGYGQAVVKAVDAIAQAIKARVVAEGVESAEHVEALKSLGCDIGQGFYYHRPMPEAQWRQLLCGGAQQG